MILIKGVGVAFNSREVKIEVFVVFDKGEFQLFSGSEIFFLAEVIYRILNLENTNISK